MKTCIAVPIKTINKRLPNKTFRLLNNKPLYTYLFTTLKDAMYSEVIDNVFVYSSNDDMLKISESWGFQPLKQPSEYDTNTAVTGDFLIEQIMPHLKEYRIIGWCHIVTPFLTKNTIEKSISILETDKDKTIDSLFGIKPIFNRLWYQDKPVNHDINHLVRTQDLIPVHEEADFYFFRNESFQKYHKRICGNFKTLEVGKVESVDIDDIEDLLYAETLIKNKLVKK